MFSIHRLIGNSLFVLILFSTALAQESRAPVDTPREPVAAVPTAPLVTATASAKRVRFVSPGTVVQLRLEVYNEAGQKLFDTELRGGNVLDWLLQDGAGQRLATGSYACVLTSKSLSGRLSQRVAVVTVNDKKAAIETAGENQLSAAQQQVITSIGGPVEGNAALTVLQESEAEAITAVTHDGTDGEVTSTKGALTFRTGDIFSGKDVERMRITPEGNVGIGTDKPEATLDVAGQVRASEGFRFADGTTLKAENGKLSVANPAGDAVLSPNATGHAVLSPNAAGTGTQNRLAKWAETGGAGTLTNSLLNESGGRIEVLSAAAGTGVTPSIANPNNVAGFAQFQFYPAAGTNSNMSFGVVPRGAGSPNNRAQFSIFGTDVLADPTNYEFAGMRARGTDFLLASGKSGSGQNRPFVLAAGFLSDNVTNANQLFLATNGNVGVGTSTPAAKLDVAGNGQFNGNLTVTGTLNATLSGNGSGMTNLNASNITTGTLDNARLGVVSTGKGGTGLSVTGAAGNFLRSNGTSWTSSALVSSDIPTGSGNYIQSNPASPQDASFNISGNGTLGGSLTAGGTLTAGGLTVDTTTLHVDATNNRVGVGTVAPGVTLDVAGDVRASGGLTVDTTTLRVDAAGDSVGIGTSAPEARLHVGAGAILLDNNQGLFLKSTTGTQKRALISDASNILRLGSDGAQGFDEIRFDLGALGNTAMALSPNGNVGVGTTTPSERLHVVGNGQFSGNLTVGGTLNGSGSGLTNIDASNITTGTLSNARLAVVPTANGGTGVSSSGASGNVLRSNGSSWETSALLPSDIPANSTNYIQNDPATQQAGSFNISTNGTLGGSLSAGGTVTSGGLTVDTNTLHVDAANNRVGVGTTAPDSALHVVGAVNFTGLRTVATTLSPNVIGGHSANEVTANVLGATISGGGIPIARNRVTDDYGTVGGGLGNRAGDASGTTADKSLATVGGGTNNTAGGSHSTIGGGQINTASGLFSTIGGGSTNFASGDASFIGGGGNNSASHLYSTVGGGESNTASGHRATVPGGAFNTALGQHSLAAGQRARAQHQGSFVWSDATTADPSFFSSTGINQFLINAAGGVGIGTNAPTASLHVVGAGRFTGDLAVNGTLFATLSGNGSGLTNLNAGNITTGTLDNARLGVVATDKGGTGLSAAGAAGSFLRSNGTIWTSSPLVTADIPNLSDLYIRNSAVEQQNGGFNILGSGTLSGSLTAGEVNFTGLRTTANARGPNVVGGHSVNSVTTNVVGATIGGGGSAIGGGADGNSPLPNLVADNYGTVGGGAGNTAGDGTAWDSSYATVGGGTNNAARGRYSAIGGGERNTASNTDSTVGGGYQNTASGFASIIGGGLINTSTHEYSTVAGGTGNIAGGSASAVSGGTGNTASGDYSVVGGGRDNTANILGSTVAGGISNSAGGIWSTVSGGESNTASGANSTVPGGIFNTAQGDYSLAAGYRAQALHRGSFVWSDSTPTGFFSSTAANQFLINATGGVGIGTNAPAPGALLHVSGAGIVRARVNSDGNAGLALTLNNQPGWSVATVAGGHFQIFNDAISQNAVWIDAANNNVGVGTTPTGYKLHVNGTVAGVGPYVNASDLRYKRDIRTIGGALSKVLSLRGVTFDWRRQEFPALDFAAGRSVGFIAQEVEQVVPEAVTRDAEGFRSVAYSHLTPVLVEAVKEQQEQITAQHKQITAQQEQITTQQQTITELRRENSALDARLSDQAARLEALERAASTSAKSPR